MSDITVLGYYGHQNCGDESYKVAFPSLFPSHTFHFVDKLDASRHYDTVILGGGNVAGDYYVKQMRQLPDSTKKYALSIGVTPTDPIADLSVCQRVLVRDPRAVELAQAAGVEAVFCPDFAWSMVPARHKGVQRLHGLFKGLDLYEKVVGVIVNANLLPRHNTNSYNQLAWEKFVADLAQLCDSTTASFVFIPFGCSRPDDRVSNGLVYHRCKWWRKCVSVMDSLSPQDTLDLVAACDAVVTTRYHATVFAAIAGVPFLDVTHHDKNLFFLKSIQLEGWGTPYYSWSWQHAATLLKTHLDGQDDAQYRALGPTQRDTVRRTCGSVL